LESDEGLFVVSSAIKTGDVTGNDVTGNKVMAVSKADRIDRLPG
jgi:hypothetical protein